MRPVREAYARGFAQLGAHTVCVGLEYRSDDLFAVLRDELRAIIVQVAAYLATPDEETLAHAIELAIVGRWPDRAYFLEVGDDDAGWIQIFQPYGVPRNDNTREAIRPA